MEWSSLTAERNVLPTFLIFLCTLRIGGVGGQIKKNVGGSIADCAYVDGVVCRKNVAHKHMRCVIRNPKIIFFSCALEYDSLLIFHQDTI